MASNEGCYSSEESNSTDAVLNYIGQILMKEGLENGTCMFSVATLQAAEKSLYDVLGEKYPSSINQTPSFCNCCGCKNIVIANNASESSLVCDFCQKKSCCVLAPPVEYTYLSNSSSSLQSFNPPNNFSNTVHGLGLVDPLPYTPLVPGSISDSKTWRLLPHGKRDHSASRLIELKKITEIINLTMSHEGEISIWQYIMKY